MQCFVFEINVSHSEQELGDLSKSVPKSEGIGGRPALGGMGANFDSVSD